MLHAINCKNADENKCPRKYSRKETRLKKPKSTIYTICMYTIQMYTITYSISEPKYIIFLFMMFSERGKYVGDAEITVNILYFFFFPSELCPDHPIHPPWWAHQWGGGTHHMAHFDFANCVLWHEWDCSTDTGNIQAQGLVGMGITAQAADALGTGRASERAAQPRSVSFCTPTTQRVTTSSVTWMAPNFIGAFATQMYFAILLPSTAQQIAGSKRNM